MINNNDEDNELNQNNSNGHETYEYPSGEEYDSNIMFDDFANDACEFEYPTSNEQSSKKALSKRVPRKIILVFIFICGCWIWTNCIFIDGNFGYRPGRSIRVNIAKDYFKQGRYIDAYDAFLSCFDEMSPKDERIKAVAEHMANHYGRYNNKLRVYFRLPYEFNISEKEKQGFGLPDFVKDEIYNYAIKNFIYKDSSVSNVSEKNKYLALSFYEMCGDYRDSEERYQYYLISYVQDLINEKNYEEAEKFLYDIKDKNTFKDFEMRINEIKYVFAKSLINSEVDHAQKILEVLAKNKYKDSEELLKRLKATLIYREGLNATISDRRRSSSSFSVKISKRRQEAIDNILSEHNIEKSEIIYLCKNKLIELGEQAYNNGEYLEAYYDLSIAQKYGPINPLVLECAKNLASSTRKIGSVVLLGHYEQDGNLDNGPEPIEWIIIAISERKALLISKYVLDVMPMNILEDEARRWEKSELRKWLNETFYNRAFNEAEKKELLKIELSSKSYSNRLIEGMGMENPYMYKLLGANDYKASDSIYDYVVCPDKSELDFFNSIADNVAYATPAINKPDNTDSYFYRHLEYYPNNFYYKNSKVSDSINDSFDSENASESQSLDNCIKCFGPIGYWLRDCSNGGPKIIYYRVVNESGMEDTENSHNKLGIRPEIMIELSESEAVVPAKETVFDKAEDILKRLEKLSKMKQDMDKLFEVK